MFLYKNSIFFIPYYRTNNFAGSMKKKHDVFLLNNILKIAKHRNGLQSTLDPLILERRYTYPPKSINYNDYFRSVFQGFNKRKQKPSCTCGPGYVIFLLLFLPEEG
uniref:Uncharacterized protein n=1 Tax=Cacopsylla melanoneura TaxID=428564 RepID=A0A8D8URC6_9HEMI